MNLLNPLLLILLLTNNLWAQEVTVEMQKNFESPKKLKNFEYVPKGYEAIDEKSRDLFFDEVGIKDRIKNFDEAEKNVLFYRIKRLSVERLIKNYPTFPQETFEKAKKKLGESV
jgi:hypothetical protein